jgi:FKBP-type peptidyl-prolyl cis-trans isomerase FklB
MSICRASQVSTEEVLHRRARSAGCDVARACLAFTLIAFGPVACHREAEKPPAPALDSDVARASYGLGYNIAGNVRNQYGPALDVAAFRAGLDDRLADAKMRVSEDQVLAGLNALNEARDSARKGLAEQNLEAGKAFLEKNGKRSGVVTLPSGLQYEILKSGDGPKPALADEVVTHYHGTLLDGSVFDSSVDRGTPVTFAVNQVIPGWQEALQLMPVGSKWKLFIPPDLAYREQGAGARIGPNQTLIFEVELLEIKKPESAG